jgi:anthranilate synthase component 2
MTRRLLIVDNYDSFTYNLFHYCETFPGVYAEVKRNDEITVSYAESFDSLLFSPGPGLPHAAGIMPELIARFYDSKKILGVCLGMQAIGEFFGARLLNAEFPMHGRASQCRLTDIESALFEGVSSPFMVGRYHSWSLDPFTLPEGLQALAFADDGTLQAVQHTKFPVFGVQFHPESVMTPMGKHMIFNWLHLQS